MRTPSKPNFMNASCHLGGTSKGGSMYMNESEQTHFLMQSNEDAIKYIKNDLVMLKDILTKLTNKQIIIQQKQAEQMSVSQTWVNISTQGHNKPAVQTHNNKHQNTGILKRTLETSDSDSTNNFNNDKLLLEQINQQSKALSNVANLLFKLEYKIDNLIASTPSDLNNSDILRGDASNTNNTNTLLNQSTGTQKKKKKKKSNSDINTVNTSSPTINTPSYYFNIGTINITGLTDIKMQQLIEYMETWDIDILGVTETSLNVKQSKFLIGTKYPKYDFFSTGHMRGTGSILIIKKTLAYYISCVEKF
ncbi:hypothetical protein RclHR1_08680008 [Rhizophagus clarus]|uniref:Endonuclease/exonuclease/phosphatase domain-containing protein n=1 Tax=Rhizophagus clarus TaxID=94130 RepID=A0A2Z6S410_9GLOM|nr:hypothetical protein RclHR1_08680008 [Rhizophagus clarus]